MITIDEVKNLEKLSRIRLSDEKREEYLGEMNSIMSYVNEIKELNLTEEEGEYAHNNIFRDDVARASAGHKIKALENAPDALGDYFKVSQVIKQ